MAQELEVREKLIRVVYQHGPPQRFTQDSPILAEVWLAYAENPKGRVDLLITPYQGWKAPSASSGQLNVVIRRRLEQMHADRSAVAAAEMAYNQSTVVGKFTFEEVLGAILPLSKWWASALDRLEKSGFKWKSGPFQVPDNLRMLTPDMIWFLHIAGIIAALREGPAKDAWFQPLSKDPRKLQAQLEPLRQAINRLLRKLPQFDRATLHEKDPLVTGAEEPEPLVYLLSLNRKAEAGIFRSRPAVKADAAARLFQIDCSELTWAVVDSGIDTRHPAFMTKANGKRHTRVRAVYDFRFFRTIISGGLEDLEKLPASLRKMAEDDPGLSQSLKESLEKGREVPWELLRPFLAVPEKEAAKESTDRKSRGFVGEHGTHVAGIIGANWPKDDKDNASGESFLGVCPDIQLMDFRVFDEGLEGEEFNIIGALQYIRYLNNHKTVPEVHGVNLSLSLRHDIKNYACGRTPVCDECDRLTGAGIVVVAAAGNLGYVGSGSLRPEEGYRAISITDPGNAETVITVGATHRDSPHTYGVSYFSSRGPTGDGRPKPDLVAPGEKIESCVPGSSQKPLDGTSMAAPHVSGAAALLMGRHPELIGRPQRIKEVLCKSATDLGRERYFQGAGMLDVLRALQSV